MIVGSRRKRRGALRTHDSAGEALLYTGYSGSTLCRQSRRAYNYNVINVSLSLIFPPAPTRLALHAAMCSVNTTCAPQRIPAYAAAGTGADSARNICSTRPVMLREPSAQTYGRGWGFGDLPSLEEDAGHIWSAESSKECRCSQPTDP